MCLLSYRGRQNLNLRCTRVCSTFYTFRHTYATTECYTFLERNFFDFKLASNIKKYKIYFSSYRHLYDGHSYILKFFLKQIATRLGTCADIVSYLCKLEKNWHQILYVSVSNFVKVACRKKVYIILFQSRVSRHICDVINFIINVICSNQLTT